MKKRILSCVAALCLFGSTLPRSAAATDIDRHWARPYILYLEALDIYRPSATTKEYKPDQKLTRAEFMRYINRAFDFTETAEINYTDVQPDSWYYETVQIAKRYGYINGVGDNQMDPLGRLTREQVAVILGRLLKVSPTACAPVDLPFTDGAAAASWSAGYIDLAAQRGILAGYEDKSFRPQGIISRGEMAKILYYYLGNALCVQDATYEGSSLNETLKNTTITKGLTLKNATIKGDLYLTEGIGEGTVVLDNVTVSGNLLHSGGRLTLQNCKIGQTIVDSPLHRVLHLTASGSTTIDNTQIGSAGTLSGQSSGMAPFSKVTIDNENAATSLTIDGTVAELYTQSGATLSLTEQGLVQSLICRGQTAITGYGTVQSADFATNGCNVASSIALLSYRFENGISAVIGGEEISTDANLGVSPSRLTIDFANDKALQQTKTFRLPSASPISSVMLQDRVLQPNTHYQRTEDGLVLHTAALLGLPVGEYTLTITLSSGESYPVAIELINTSSDADLKLSFDRYYLSEGFRDVPILLDGIREPAQISQLTIDGAPLNYSLQSALGGIILRRSTLATYSAGDHTIQIMLADGTTRTATLSIANSTPEGAQILLFPFAAAEPYAVSFAPISEQGFTMLLRQSGRTLVEGLDYQVQPDKITIEAETLLSHKDQSYVELVLTYADGQTQTIVIDYI